jgi:hypothetical protein
MSLVSGEFDRDEMLKGMFTAKRVPGEIDPEKRDRDL